MSDTTPLTHTVFFGRKCGLPNYSNQEASIFIQVDADRDESAESVADKLMAAFVQAKSQVFTQLGIEHELSSEGVLVETGVAAPPTPPARKDAVTTLRESFPGAVVEPNVQHVDFSASSDVDPLTLSKPEQKRWLQARLQTHPNEFFDNTQSKRNPKAPDYKHKSSGLGLWAS